MAFVLLFQLVIPSMQKLLHPVGLLSNNNLMDKARFIDKSDHNFVVFLPIMQAGGVVRIKKNK